MRKETSEQNALTELKMLIVNLNESLNIGKKMTAVQIETAAQDIIEDYYYLNLADFALCFKNGRKLRYGEIYDRMDSSVILGWLNKYIEERTTFSANRSEHRHSQVKHNREVGAAGKAFQKYLNNK